jgi:serine/threonine protein kinase
MYGYYISPNLALVSELVSRGSLDKLIEDGEVTDERSFSLIYGIAKGMLHLASEKVVHKDLACRNVLITNDWVPKVSDFGLARAVEDTHTTKSMTGPLKWLAPESLVSKIYSEKSDVWMFAVTSTEVLSRALPYAKSHPTLQGFDIASDVGRKRLKPFSDEMISYCQPLPSEMVDLLTSCVEYDPSDRPTFAVIVRKLRDVVG